MRILVTTTVFPRWDGDASPAFIENLCRDLVAAGCRITVLAPHSHGSAFSENRDGMQIIRFPYFWPLRFQTLCYGGGMIVRKRENKWRLLQLPFLCAGQFAAIHYLLSRDFDLIHAHSLLPQGWIGGLSNFGGIPLVISSHGSDVFLLDPKWRPFLRAAVTSASALIANSTATAEQILALGGRRSRIHRIPATPSYPDPDQPTHVPPLRPTLLFAGRLIPEKGVDALLEAMPRIRQVYPDCTLRLAGSGVLESHLRQKVAELRLSEQVFFLGWLPAEQLRKEMQRATLLVAPSRVIEGQNLVVTEALSVGCPVATTPRGGMLDLVRDGETGFIISAPEPVKIAEKIIDFLNHPDRGKVFGENGYAHFINHFSRKNITASIIRLYEKLISAR